MFNRLKLRYKVLISPAIAVFGFAIILLVFQSAASEVSKVSQRVRDSYVAGLALNQEISNTIFRIQQEDLLGWGQTLDESMGDEARDKADLVSSMLQQAQENPTYDDQKVADLRQHFEEYFQMAYDLIDEVTTAADGVKEDVDWNRLGQIQEPYSALDDKLKTFLDWVGRNLKQGPMSAYSGLLEARMLKSLGDVYDRCSDSEGALAEFVHTSAL